MTQTTCNIALDTNLTLDGEPVVNLWIDQMRVALTPQAAELLAYNLVKRAGQSIALAKMAKDPNLRPLLLAEARGQA